MEGFGATAYQAVNSGLLLNADPVAGSSAGSDVMPRPDAVRRHLRGRLVSEGRKVYGGRVFKAFRETDGLQID